MENGHLRRRPARRGGWPLHPGATAGGHLGPIRRPTLEPADGSTTAFAAALHPDSRLRRRPARRGAGHFQPAATAGGHLGRVRRATLEPAARSTTAFAT